MSNKQVISKWFYLYSDDIYQFLFYRLSSKHHDVEDLVQEVFIRALRNLDRFKGEASPKTWLYSIAKNVAIDAIRKSKRDKWKWLLLIESEKVPENVTMETPEEALFSFILFIGTEDGAPRSSVPEEKYHENYISYLRDTEVHDQIEENRAYIGNNGALGKYHGQVLPGKYYANGMELQTSEDPMGINMYYKVTDQTSATAFEKDAFHVSNLPLTLIFNATTYFAFFKNGEYVTFHIDYLGDMQTYTIRRLQIEELYGRNVREFHPDKELWEEEVINNILTDERKVEEFMKSIEE